MSETKSVTAFEVVEKRVNELTNEHNALVMEKKELMSRIIEIDRRMAEIEVETHVMQSYSDRRTLVTYTETKSVTVQREERPRFHKNGIDRLNFEDTVTKILAPAPMRLSHLKDKLEQAGFPTSNYQTFYSRITSLDIVEKVPQTHGVYQLRRRRD